MRKEPVKKRRHLTRFFTSLVSVTLFIERKRGDGAFYVPHGRAAGYLTLAAVLLAGIKSELYQFL